MADKKSPQEQKGEGTWDEAKGRMKEAGGAVTGDDETKREGKADQMKGKAKQKIGEGREKLREKI